MIARNEETGEVGAYPVAAIMGRQATDLVWLGLEASGQSSRLGVTAEHPLYVGGRGWVQAGDLVVGDRIVNADGGVITVVSRELDDRPTLVHNLEVAGASTYFAGELEAWGHNKRSKLPNVPRNQRDKKRCFSGDDRNSILSGEPNCRYCGAPSIVVDHVLPHAKGGRTTPSNGAGCCLACNFDKSDQTLLEFWKNKWRYK